MFEPIIIKADRFLNYYGRVFYRGLKPKAFAFWPFIFVNKSAIHPNLYPYIINHEKIHLAQQLESLHVILFIVEILEGLYVRVFTKKRGLEAYIFLSQEQEAYANMFDLDYLQKRKMFANFGYLKNKKATWVDVYKKYLEIEGFPHVFEWKDSLGEVYETHAHKDKVSFYLLEGSLEFDFGGSRVNVVAPCRYDVPQGVEHSAKVGSKGAHYVVGEMIEGDS